MKRRMIYFAAMLGVVVVAGTTLTVSARAGYETAEYKVLETDGNVEIREYPDLLLAATKSDMDAQGRDGSFMRLFRYISGANEGEQKIAMTTPVFMEGEVGDSNVSMGFVMPKELATEGVPEPKGDGVEIRERKGGRFAVIRFSGRLNSRSAEEQEAKLRKWMKMRGLTGASQAEAAGYDPPFTPGPFRRNEVLIRLDAPENTDSE